MLRGLTRTLRLATAALALLAGLLGLGLVGVGEWRGLLGEHEPRVAQELRPARRLAGENEVRVSGLGFRVLG